MGSRVTLFIIGYLWMLVIPLPGLGRITYIDENALQPSQVWLREPWSVLFNSICILRLIPIGTGTMFMLQTSTLLNWKKYAMLISRVNSQNIQLLGLSTFKFSFSRRAQFINTEFLKLGLSSSIQNYAFSASTAVYMHTFLYCDNGLTIRSLEH